MKYSFLSLVSAATDLPVSLADVKEFLRVDTDDENGLISGLIQTATETVEADTGRVLVSQTWRIKFAAPSGDVCLPLAPVTSITSLDYQDTDDASQTLIASVIEARSQSS